MRTYDEISADARGGSAFSNGTSFELWADAPGGCWTCRNDDAATEKHCPILSVALAVGKTPAEWIELPDSIQDYTCTQYDARPDDDGPDGGEPEPDPEPPPVIDGQVDMFEVFVDQGIADLPAPVRTGGRPAMTTHDECDFGGEWVRCDRCGHEYVCKPTSDYYCTPDGDHCCELCLIGGYELHVIDLGPPA